MLQRLEAQQLQMLKFWFAPLLSGLIAWLLLLGIGETPFTRASGLAVVIIGVAASLRRMGSWIAVIGSLTLALSPVFWSQTGGGEGSPATIVIAILAAVISVLLVVAISRRPSVAIGIGIIIFAGLFWSQIGTERSLRLTSFVIAWLMFLLVDMLLLTNPRPDDQNAPLLLLGNGVKRADGSQDAQPYHTFGILLLLGLGILNDPLLTLLAPAVVLALNLSKTKLPVWYWLGIGLVFGMGIQGIFTTYFGQQAHLLNIASWRDGARWGNMVVIIYQQFSIVGIILGILGLARLARWYPPLGTTLMLAFAAYWIFGLVYYGNTRDVLLLPAYVIFVIWISYAVMALSEWFSKSFQQQTQIGRFIPIVAYAILPSLLLINILR